ncbi:hypothetical protein PTKU64_85690 [Paraburkholderia terrae]|uniref:Uncharacterized protein n=1 Tax=Paraburkholderia terrae TaxID=311230 RepID=A0ABM7U140_9BURK|nr:hypothetical protein PTKU64_85690 [Paraburkholderia terrae]BDC44869.1 hypothetical protein PTKU15_81660 [Paraburkholderia terrae]
MVSSVRLCIDKIIGNANPAVSSDDGGRESAVNAARIDSRHSNYTHQTFKFL